MFAEKSLVDIIHERVSANALQLPVFHHVALKLMHILSKENFSIAQVAQMVMEDQALTSHVLRMANSAFFGGALYVDPGGSLTVTGGSNLHDNSIGIFDGTQGGGAIYNRGTLIVDNAQIHDNQAQGAGGGIDNESPGSLQLTNSVLRHNTAGGGGAIETSGNATVQTTTLADNTAQLYGGAIDATDRTDTSKALTVTASTLSGNNAGLHGGAIESEMKLTLTNVTISGNPGPEAIDHYDRAITLTNVTIAQNTGTGLSLHGSPTLLLRNTLLASNTGGNCASPVTSNGFNLADDTTCGLTTTGDHQGAAFNPRLGPLQNNGGPTQTQLPGPGSPAIDNGTGISAPAKDQRGVMRPQGAAFDIGAVEVAPNDVPTPTPTPTPTTIQFSASSYSVGEGDQRVTLTVTRAGDMSAAASVGFVTSDSAGSQPCNVFNGLASSRCDYLISFGTVQFAAGESSKTFSIPIIDDSHAEGTETFTVSLNNPSGAALGAQSATTVMIVDNDSVTGPNPVDQSSFFVRQHYLDFLNREPDPSGFSFWVNNIESCGADVNCREVKRIDTSAAFFLSIEFQGTGYLVERIYNAAYGDATGASTFGGAHQLFVPIVRLNEFLPDTQEIGLGVVVGQGNWQQQLENNKQAFTLEFVQRSRFTTAFATSMTPAQFVDKLFLNARMTPTASDRTAAINEFGSATTTTDVGARSRALRDVAETSTLNQQEFNRAFVLMQYLGYLRRNPNDAPDADYTGYDFWLTKLNQFNGNYGNAEMVKAFIVSVEFRQRFGP